MPIFHNSDREEKVEMRSNEIDVGNFFKTIIQFDAIIRCVLASLYEGLSVRQSVGPLVRPLIHQSVV